MIYLFSFRSTTAPLCYYHLFYTNNRIYKYFSIEKYFENDNCKCNMIDYNIITGKIDFYHPQIYVEIFLKLESDEFILEYCTNNDEIEINICKYISKKIFNNI